MRRSPLSRSSVEQAVTALVLRARILWAGLLFGPASFLAMIVWLSTQENFRPTVAPSFWLTLAGWGAAVLLPVVGLVIRARIAPTGEEAPATVIHRWFLAHVVTWVACELASAVSIVLLFLTGETAVFLPAAALPLLFHVLLFPRRV